MPNMWHEILKMWKINHFEKVCRSQSRQTPRHDKRGRAAHDMCQYNKDVKVALQHLDVVRSKVFSFHAVRSAIMVKLSTKSSKNMEMCKFKLDTASNGNLMPIIMNKLIFLHTNINNLNKSIKRKIVLYAPLTHSYHKGHMLYFNNKQRHQILVLLFCCTQKWSSITGDARM